MDELRITIDLHAGHAGSDTVDLLYPIMDEVARREGWDDLEMDAYDQLDPRMNRSA
jgi:hypothetical protein